MYNCLRELHRCFNTEPDCPELNTELASLEAQLKPHLGEAERKLLLRLLDTQTTFRYETSLESFAAGFRTAHSIFCEAHACPYSYEDAEAERIFRSHRRKDRDTP